MKVTYEIDSNTDVNTWPQQVHISIMTTSGDGDFRSANEAADKALTKAYNDARMALSSWEQNA